MKYAASDRSERTPNLLHSHQGKSLLMESKPTHTKVIMKKIQSKHNAKKEADGI